jgi:transcriptional regulator GlxA family with amidase domain
MTAANLPLLPGPIGFVLIPPFASIALASAIEPLRIANRYLRNAYRWKLLSRDGFRVTMHWEVLEAFRERFARTAVAQTLFELDGRRLTCAGSTAAIDLVLEAIARDHGSELAARVAEHCLHERIRPGGAAQRMAPAARGRIHHPALAQAVALLEATPERSVGVPELAAHAGRSPRQLLRLFAQVVGEGPSRYHRRLRLEHARGLLRHTALAVTDAAVAAGLESLAHFCRAYRQQYGVSPGADRQARTAVRSTEVTQ